MRLSGARTNIGIKPFKKSPRKVAVPANGPAILYILVAPGFIEPYFLGSFVAISLCTIIAKGIDPIQ